MNVSESVSTVILFRGAVTWVGSWCCRGIFSNVLEVGASTFAPPKIGGGQTPLKSLPTAPEPLTISSSKILPS